jgi:hypothetical protein
VLPSEADTDLIAAGPRLHARLRESLSSDAERHLFLVYAERNGTFGFDQPALVPHIWLHYDPKASWQRDGVPPLARVGTATATTPVRRRAELGTARRADQPSGHRPGVG